MINISGYGSMIADKTRVQAYQNALRVTLTPGSTVLDIGAGTGIFSLLACRLGAGHVHAVEPGDVIQIAKEMANANGFADRITFHQAMSNEVALPTRADVIVSDLRGVLPLHGRHIPAIIDARRRLLAPDGVMIPLRDTLWAAPVSDPQLYEEFTDPWLVNNFDLDMRAGRLLAVNTWRKTSAQPDHLLTQPLQWATLDYTTIKSPNLSGDLTWFIDRVGTAHGLLVWFDTDLAPGIGYSNAPGGARLVYGQGFFPFQEPVNLEPGDTVSVRLRADLAGNHYVWQWRTRVHTFHDTSRVQASFVQSTIHGIPLSFAPIRRRETHFQPALDKTGQVDFFLLSLMDGQTTLDEIVTRALEEFPGYFSDRNEAQTRAGDLSVKYAGQVMADTT